jgi:hypothetical protein
MLVQSPCQPERTIATRDFNYLTALEAECDVRLWDTAIAFLEDEKCTYPGLRCGARCG